MTLNLSTDLSYAIYCRKGESINRCVTFGHSLHLVFRLCEHSTIRMEPGWHLVQAAHTPFDSNVPLGQTQKEFRVPSHGWSSTCPRWHTEHFSHFSPSLLYVPFYTKNNFWNKETFTYIQYCIQDFVKLDGFLVVYTTTTKYIEMESINKEMFLKYVLLRIFSMYFISSSVYIVGYEFMK